ncbi:hypothetical protein CEXT_603421 [Caerostris extrusa]|uniref:Uncharacterized protein n=1 Tax=Caerostris extrusa TaxID=172846 RepID=A0AAV4PVE0_CAEEX|nr:hypothetical protein CEXT_603421 [Caerostris extrusa]
MPGLKVVIYGALCLRVMKGTLVLGLGMLSRLGGSRNFSFSSTSRLFLERSFSRLENKRVLGFKAPFAELNLNHTPKTISGKSPITLGIKFYSRFVTLTPDF